MTDFRIMKLVRLLLTVTSFMHRPTTQSLWFGTNVAIDHNCHKINHMVTKKNN